MEENPKLKSADVALLSEAMETFNSATAKLSTSYELLNEETRKLRDEVVEKNRELSYVSSLLESVLNNTRSAILVVDTDSRISIKNRAADRLLQELGETSVHEMLEVSPKEGVSDYQTADDRHYRISVGGNSSLVGTVITVEDITTLKRFEQELRRNEELQTMGEMAANIAHEIRNPLGSIELFASLLERDTRGNENAGRFTSNIVKAVRTINSVISNILLFTKDFHVEKKEHVLSDIVDDAVLYLTHKVAEKQVSIQNKIDENHTVECDRALFYQVVMNIIHNAFDAVKEGGKVEIRSENGEFLRLKVRDNGTGIPYEMRSKLFLPFQTTKAKGTGLGLYIAYKIVKAHGGDIFVDSDGVSYTEFAVVLSKRIGENF